MGNTGIKIKATKVVNSMGENGYEIKEIVALSHSELPKLYVEGTGPVIFLGQSYWNGEKNVLKWKRDGQSFMTKSGHYHLCQSKFYTAEGIKEIMAHVQAAGEHLADVNQALARKRAKWQGNVSFVDGVIQHSQQKIEDAKRLLSKEYSSEIAKNTQNFLTEKRLIKTDKGEKK